MEVPLMVAHLKFVPTPRLYKGGGPIALGENYERC